MNYTSKFGLTDKIRSYTYKNISFIAFSIPTEPPVVENYTSILCYKYLEVDGVDYVVKLIISLKNMSIKNIKKFCTLRKVTCSFSLVCFKILLSLNKRPRRNYNYLTEYHSSLKI